MKRRQIEKKLRFESDRFTPDPLEKIKLAAQSEHLLPSNSEQPAKVRRQVNTAVKARSKRKTFGFLSSFAAAVACITLLLVFALTGGNHEPDNSSPAMLSVKDIYGMGAVSTVKLLNSGMSPSAVKSFSAINRTVSIQTASETTANDNNATSDDVKTQAKKFNEYFSALDSFLGDDIVSTSTASNTDGEYPYETKMTITGKDFGGNTILYSMYYTEYPTADKTDDDNDDDEEEKHYRLVGIMAIDGTNFYLEGERSEETEEDETETELKIRAYADRNDKNSYVQMEQELSVESGETEKEYVYSIYSNGILIEQTAVTFETEKKGGKIETEYELEFRNGAGKGKYTVEREVKNNRALIKVKYNIDGTNGVFHIRETTDENDKKQYEYTFGDNDTMLLFATLL